MGWFWLKCRLHGIRSLKSGTMFPFLRKCSVSLSCLAVVGYVPHDIPFYLFSPLCCLLFLGFYFRRKRYDTRSYLVMGEKKDKKPIAVFHFSLSLFSLYVGFSVHIGWLYRVCLFFF